MGTFEAVLLPDSEKETLARTLLEEFDAQRITSHGGELIHSCILPFGMHKNGDRNPSASFNYKKLTYKCLGCGSGGGLLWFIATMRGEGTKQARAWLNKTAGLGTVMDLSDLLRYFDAVYHKETDRRVIPHYDPRVLEPWLLLHPYMTEVRRVPEATLKKMKVGWDSQRDRIIIPHFVGESLVGWQARRLDPDDPEPMKYKNSPDFPKDYTIYNYDYLAPYVVVVESPLSVLRHQHHVPVEGTFGASVTDAQMKMLSKHPKVILWFDNDKAGWKATREVGNYLMRYTDVWAVNNPYAADMGDMDEWMVTELLESAVPYAIWELPRRLRCHKCLVHVAQCTCKG